MIKEDIRFNACYETMFGPKISQKRAQIILPMLVERVYAKDTISFGELAKEFNISKFALAIRPAVTRVTGTLYHLENKKLPEAKFQWEHGKIPRITNLVIKSNGRPAGWICDQLGKVPTPQEYKVEVLARIYEYEKWDEVLKALGLNK